MNDRKKITVAAMCTVAAAAAIGIAAATTGGQRDVSQKTSEASVVTNGNGTVSRTFTECTVATNGSMVTEHRRETRTTLDAKGNMLESSTSEYAQSYPTDSMTAFKSLSGGGLVTVTDAGTGEPVDGVETEVSVEIVPANGAKNASAKAKSTVAASNADSFLGLKFGSVLKGTNFISTADEPTLLRTRFTPKKKLSGFDDYYVFVTPTTHKVVKIYACAKQAVDPGDSWRRHYLIEALEKRYQTWARPQSAFRPVYSFDIGGGRFVTTCLRGATPDYGTVVVAWDDALLTVAADETEEIRNEAIKAAAKKRASRVKDAADAF